MCGWGGVGIGWFVRCRRCVGIVLGFSESFEDVGPSADDGDCEEENKKGGSVGVEEGAGGGFEEDVEGGNHGSDAEEGSGNGAGGEEDDVEVEPEGEGDGPKKGVPVLEPVEDGVAKEGEGDDEGGFLVGRKPVIGNTDDGYADRH